MARKSDNTKGDDQKLTAAQKRAQKHANKKIDEGYVKRGAKKITDDDVKKVLNREKEIREKFEKEGPLGRFVEDVKLLISLVRDYWGGAYREIPWLTIAAIVFALLYVLSPIDLIPDFIPVVGYVDDALVVAVCLRLVEQDLHDYKGWKVKQAGNSA